MFSSTSDEWATPQDLFDRLNAIFHYNLDAAALPHNAKCERYFTPEQNGLAQRWSGNVWLNPPYGRKIGEWVRKAYEEVAGGGGFLGDVVASGTDGHGMVSRLLHKRFYCVFARTAEIWRRKERCSVSEHDCDFYAI